MLIFSVRDTGQVLYRVFATEHPGYHVALLHPPSFIVKALGQYIDLPHFSTFRDMDLNTVSLPGGMSLGQLVKSVRTNVPITAYAARHNPEHGPSPDILIVCNVTDYEEETLVAAGAFSIDMDCGELEYAELAELVKESMAEYKLRSTP